MELLFDLLHGFEENFVARLEEFDDGDEDARVGRLRRGLRRLGQLRALDDALGNEVDVDDADDSRRQRRRVHAVVAAVLVDLPGGKLCQWKHHEGETGQYGHDGSAFPDKEVM